MARERLDQRPTDQRYGCGMQQFWVALKELNGDVHNLPGCDDGGGADAPTRDHAVSAQHLVHAHNVALTYCGFRRAKSK
jgi:hypothetical protein